jgi:hypothetical protein
MIDAMISLRMGEARTRIAKAALIYRAAGLVSVDFDGDCQPLRLRHTSYISEL